MASEAFGHHLLKHAAPSMEHVVECFDGTPPKDISRLIAKMGQRELQVWRSMHQDSCSIEAECHSVA